jgi:uncharacterized glyoxalase superfamily protein PhnB
MPVTSLDHVYAETRAWDAAVAFWEGLGFEFAQRWGSEGHRAGTLVSGDASVVLAEIPPGDSAPVFNVFFALDAADTFRVGAGVEVTTPLEPTHWGTRWMRVTDPEGRTHVLEETP